ncbi:pyridoxamine 5'-phosphate oxidase family protein [Evansella sp. AB-P1]|uniref:pyridoxamine 5'-phosphate oxidase family protein n=1 Tax=Evansella sp. AB-P1 TaxID=3037653 RepID=UPI00241E12F2|nr:pyridoxamine 5'-phosphate oxidase family protein [Evansella sp. AB-P1]MDG5786628.1 pyridoxamine 5'-phosphate oxidase family protein [Evansella sp. AB-P1]
MGKYKRELTEELIHFIKQQKLFFVATAPSDEGRINLSPKGYDSLVVIDSHTIAYLDYAGSGNETANHINDNKKITFMWCSFEETPLILRAYCFGHILEKDGDVYHQYMQKYFEEIDPKSARRIFICDIEAIQTSCGFGVPLFDYIGERDTMAKWTEKQLANGNLDQYIEEHSARLEEKFPLLKK